MYVFESQLSVKAVSMYVFESQLFSKGSTDVCV